ncbi:ATP synthase subunit I [Sutterella sp.]|uniref:ATP synthase subunit I n=1 Tax=Sutterella sp. TaxID=1981025 RepID=UPI0026DFA5EE|nr:ATP synthase subunit I [Sutterella sp.]MDO5530443.1 ATP synthase subunit I [Sutterella sp.]
MLARSDMMRVVLAQYAITLVAALLGFVLLGKNAGLSALLGGLCYAVATTLLVITLIALRGLRLSPTIGALTTLLGEFVKVLFVILLMLLTARLFHELNWLVYLISLIAVMNGYFVLLFKKKQG